MRITERLRSRLLLAVAITAGSLAGVGVLPVASLVASTPPRPSVLSVTPAHGPAAGGNQVVVTTSLSSLVQTRFWFGDREAAIVSSSGGQATLAAPAGLSGTTVDVAWTSFQSDKPFGVAGAADDYTYDGRTRLPLTLTPGNGAPKGGNTVTVTGAGIEFSSASEVRFGDEVVTITGRTANSVSVEVPAGKPNTDVRVSVTTQDDHVDGTNLSRYHYDFSPDPPVVTGLSMTRAYVDTYPAIIVYGTALENATKIDVGGESMSIDRFYTGEGIRFYGGHVPGTFDVRVTTPAGTSANTPADDFTYLAVPPPPIITSVTPNKGGLSGGTLVTVRGKNLGDAMWVHLTYEGVDAPFQQISDEEVRFRTVPHAETLPVAQEVQITAPGGTTATRTATTADDFTYVDDLAAAPAITGLSSRTGLAGFGGVTTISGRNLTSIRGVRFGSAKATAWYIVGSKLVVVAPPLPKGTYSVRVTTAAGTSAGSTASTYQYLGR